MYNKPEPNRLEISNYLVKKLEENRISNIKL